MYTERRESLLFLLVRIVFYVLLTIYFIYHTIGGKYGVFSYKNVNEVLVKQRNILNKTNYEVKKKQNRIDRLKNDNLDLDLLEEELKSNIGIADKNEIVLLTDDLKKM
jgi:cell division protein FtsB